MVTLLPHALVVLAALSGTAGAFQQHVANAAPPARIVHAGLPNCWRVAPRLYRSAQPTAEGYRHARSLGVTTVICLRALPEGAAGARAAGLRYVHIPTQPWTIDRATLRRVLREIASADGPVLVHCRRGADRTGAAVAAYRVCAEGWGRQAAIREMTSSAYGYWRGWMNLTAQIESL